MGWLAWKSFRQIVWRLISIMILISHNYRQCNYKKKFWSDHFWFSLADFRTNQTKCLISYFEHWLLSQFCLFSCKTPITWRRNTLTCNWQYLCYTKPVMDPGFPVDGHLHYTPGVATFHKMCMSKRKNRGPLGGGADCAPWIRPCKLSVLQRDRVETLRCARFSTAVLYMSQSNLRFTTQIYTPNPTPTPTTERWLDKNSWTISP